MAYVQAEATQAVQFGDEAVEVCYDRGLQNHEWAGQGEKGICHFS